jgi:hypothetical protein
MWKTLHHGGHRGKEGKSPWWRGWTLGLAAAFIVATALQAQPPDLDDLLDKAADYVVG